MPRRVPRPRPPAPGADPRGERLGIMRASRASPQARNRSSYGAAQTQNSGKRRTPPAPGTIAAATLSGTFGELGRCGTIPGSITRSRSPRLPGGRPQLAETFLRGFRSCLRHFQFVLGCVTLRAPRGHRHGQLSNSPLQLLQPFFEQCLSRASRPATARGQIATRISFSADTRRCWSRASTSSWRSLPSSSTFESISPCSASTGSCTDRFVHACSACFKRCRAAAACFSASSVNSRSASRLSPRLSATVWSARYSATFCASVGSVQADADLHDLGIAQLRYLQHSPLQRFDGPRAARAFLKMELLHRAAQTSCRYRQTARRFSKTRDTSDSRRWPCANRCSRAVR